MPRLTKVFSAIKGERHVAALSVWVRDEPSFSLPYRLTARYNREIHRNIPKKQ